MGLQAARPSLALAHARALQRLRGHRQLHQGRPRGYRAQQLDQLSNRRAREHRLRYRARAGQPYPDGRHGRTDPQRRRFRRQFRRHHDHGDHYQPLQRFRSRRLPEFARARKAMQYSASIDDFARIMKDGNNGGYANTWLVADRKTNEIASLELGLKNVTLDRTRDGYFVGSNFPINEKLAREETEFDLKNSSESANARHARWLQLMKQNKGKIDVRAAERFLADHFDTYENKVDPDERSLCGHIDRSPRGDLPWVGPYGPVGAVQSKVSDAAMAEAMTLQASLGHSCGLGFKAAEHLRSEE